MFSANGKATKPETPQQAHLHNSLYTGDGVVAVSVQILQTQDKELAG